MSPFSPQRDADFLSRLQRHRYVGTDQNKYEDDYYADKVLTLSDYRQWVRQQQRKREAAAIRSGSEGTGRDSGGVWGKDGSTSKL